MRAIKEETDLHIAVDTVFRHDIYYSPTEGVQKQVIFFVAEPWSLATKCRGNVVSVEWMFYKKAIEAMTYETDREVLKHATAYLTIKLNLNHNPSEIIRTNGYLDLWYREHAVDIHSHVMPRMDDGAQTMDEAMELLRLDWEEGVRVVFATPHYGIENGYAPDQNDVWLGFNRLSEAAHDKVPGMRIEFGNEIYCSEDVVDRIRRHEAWALMPTGWYMVEFLEWGTVTESAEDILRRLKKLKEAGIKTILAHPERNKAIQQDWDLAKRICDLGVRLQVNAYDLFLNRKQTTCSLAQWMAKEELISFVGSDMHGTRPGKRMPHLLHLTCAAASSMFSALEFGLVL